MHVEESKVGLTGSWEVRRLWDMEVVPSQEEVGRGSYRGSGMKNGRSKGPEGILSGSECSQEFSMALGMREISSVGQEVLTCSSCLDIQPPVNFSLLSAHINDIRDNFGRVSTCLSLLGHNWSRRC